MEDNMEDNMEDWAYQWQRRYRRRLHIGVAVQLGLVAMTWFITILMVALKFL